MRVGSVQKNDAFLDIVRNCLARCLSLSNCVLAKGKDKKQRCRKSRIHLENCELTDSDQQQEIAQGQVPGTPIYRVLCEKWGCFVSFCT